MTHSWKKLKTMTADKKLLISSVVLPDEDVEIKGRFELPPLAELSMEDQIFIAAFIKTHGSIKQMESIFGISYPTVKNRLNRIADSLDIIDVKVDIKESVASVLDRLENGDIDVDQALKEIE